MMSGVECPEIILRFITFPRRGNQDEVRTQKELKTQVQIRMKIKVMTALQQDAAGAFYKVSWDWG